MGNRQEPETAASMFRSGTDGQVNVMIVVKSNHVQDHKEPGMGF